jgi:hypothetical protein
VPAHDFIAVWSFVSPMFPSISVTWLHPLNSTAANTIMLVMRIASPSVDSRAIDCR